ncbi:capsule assembly Wzi family protein [Escherichia coli]|uniref:capsule assembly Wzi family protein n=1 Tax=Escherichia coli TaxID=562 RepID=UPI0013609D54|nr:capsule assembly Wzi family protein [Escherichia coli]
MFQRLIFVTGLLLVWPFSSLASGLVMNDSELRDDLLWLSARGVIRLNLSTWPLSYDEINRALKKAKPSYSSEQIALARVEQRLVFLKADSRIGGYASTDTMGIPSGFAQTRFAESALSLAFNAGGEGWDMHLQGNMEKGSQLNKDSTRNVNGSYGAVEFWNQWLVFGQIPQWWGPGYEGSLIRGDAARPVTGFMLQRALQSAPQTWWLRWIGPWQYQVFAGQLTQYTAYPHTRLTGGRLTLSPFSSLEFGASRVMQWGGKGRPRSWRYFWEGMVGRDNKGSFREPGNQLAGFDARWNLEPVFGIPVSFYGQMVGEDEAGFLPSAWTFLGGIEGHHSVGKEAINWYVEVHDTRADMRRLNTVYTHHIYTDGYYQQGYPLGDATGGDGQLYAARIERVSKNNQRWNIRLIYAKVNPESQSINKVFPHSDRLKGIELGWRGDVYHSIRLNSSLWFIRARHSKHDNAGVGVGIEIPFNL